MTAIVPQPTKLRRKPAPCWPGTIAIPLAEFGKSLDDADLDEWFEAFLRNGTPICTSTKYPARPPADREPVNHYGAAHELRLAGALLNWTDEHGGMAYGANSLFILPDGSRFGPDAAWIREERRDELMLPGNRPFARIVPDFIAEIKSPSNSNAELVNKIDLFLQHGTKLGWFIDAETRTVITFRPGREPEVLHDPEYIDGDDDVLPGFRFAVRERIFDLFPNAE